MAHRTASRGSSVDEERTGAAFTAMRLVAVISCLAAIFAMANGLWGDTLRGSSTSVGIGPEATTFLIPPGTADVNTAFPAPQLVTPSPNAQAPVDQTGGVPRIGIVAGHWESDTGAMCPDGLTEVEINLDIARRVVYILQALGYQVDLLTEFDPQLRGYQADALVSIHADSCQAFPNATPPASGFKVASVEDSLVPEAEERLVSCLAQCYAARTEMYFHANSITYDMTRYHTFYEIDNQTPGAIIETGFMLNDRRLLTERPDLVAQGIADGIVCFIQGENP